MGKLSIMELSGFAIGGMGFFGSFEIAQRPLFKRRAPFLELVALLQRYALKAAGVIGLPFAIDVVLKLRGTAQVTTPIIEAIHVPMIHKNIHAQDDAMK